MFDTLLDPTVDPVAGPGAAHAGAGGPELAARPPSLRGVRLGILANTKRNAEEILRELAARLERDHAVTTAVAVKKLSIVDPVPADLLAQLTAGCDVAVVGVGDCGSCSASAVADGLLLEKAGIPAAVICSDAFRVSADAMADVRGAAGYRYLTTAHPVANLDADGRAERAEQLVTEVAALLGAPVAAAS